MGLEQSVTFTSEPPAWPAVRDLLARHGLNFEMRMIDGELALPDEEPPATWCELRLAAAGRMITLRRDAQRITFVVWGNADAALLQARNALTWAFATTGTGTITTEGGACTIDEFRHSADLPESVRRAEASS
jgi:hypothetical protein